MQTLNASITIKHSQTANLIKGLLRGLADVVSVQFSTPDHAADSILDTVEAPQSAAAPRERPTLAELDAMIAADPEIQAYHRDMENADWSWLSEGKTKDTVTMADIRDMRLKERYGD
jgi:hypothetical protein